jgi:hypothetical protein
MEGKGEGLGGMIHGLNHGTRFSRGRQRDLHIALRRPDLNYTRCPSIRWRLSMRIVL